VSPKPEEMDGWKEWSKHVLLTLKEHSEQLEKIRTEAAGIRLDMLKLQLELTNKLTKLETELYFKSGLWGLAAGCIPAIGAILLLILSKAK